ncbi:hypothetical protein [Nitrosomonas sp.]|nr:hypothetical protein [Nitrosomonas sp.]
MQQIFYPVSFRLSQPSGKESTQQFVPGQLLKLVQVIGGRHGR